MTPNETQTLIIAWIAVVTLIAPKITATILELIKDVHAIKDAIGELRTQARDNTNNIQKVALATPATEPQQFPVVGPDGKVAS